MIQHTAPQGPADLKATASAADPLSLVLLSVCIAVAVAATRLPIWYECMYECVNVC